MVVGNGMVAQRFQGMKNEKEFLFFASGVSNSKCNNINEYEREFELLKNSLKQYPDKHLVYFSTTSIYDASENKSMYVQHKLNIEKYIIEHVQKFTIFRLSNLVGKSQNTNTIVNYFVQQISLGTSFQLWKNATRNLIDIDDAFAIIEAMLSSELFQNKIVNVANSISYTTLEIVQAIEQLLAKPAHYDAVDKGVSFKIDTHDMKIIVDKLAISFDENYLNTLLKKYYAA